MSSDKRLRDLFGLRTTDRKRFRRELAQLAFSVLATVAALLLSLVSSFPGMFAKPTPSTERLQKLDRAREALQELDSYLASQQQSIRDSEATLAELQRKRTELDKVVTINQEAAEALLSFQERKNAGRAWFAYAMSFILGVLSSLSATLLIDLRRKVRRAAPATAGAAERRDAV